MKILLYGECSVAGSGAWCYAETLREMGHQVIEFSDQEGLQHYQHNLLARMFRRIAHRALETDRQRHINALLQVLRRERPATVIILKGLNIGSRDVRALKEDGTWVCLVNHDDFFSQNRCNWSRVQRSAISEYDYVFTTREVNVADIFPLNPRVEFFPFAYYPRIHRPVRIPDVERDAWGVDVVFVGTWERQRCRQLEELVRRVPARYAIWGTQWEKLDRNSPLRKFVHRRPVVLDEMAKALGGAKLALAFLRKENRDDYTQRTFEIPACGGVLLAERTARHEQLYREGIEAEFFEAASDAELAAKVAFLLRNDTHRERLRRAGREALLTQRHTYADRLTRLLTVYQSPRAPCAYGAAVQRFEAPLRAEHSVS